MKFKAALKNLTIDYATGEAVISLTADKSVLKWVEELTGKPIAVELKEWKEKRSLNQNDLWHKLLGLLADALGYSKPYMKNVMLRRYGQLDTMNGKLVEFIIRESQSDMVDEYEYLHLAPTSHTITMQNGEVYRLYYKLKGSHELNTEEMARLLEGTIEDCREQGIYDERMYRVWSTGD